MSIDIDAVAAIGVLIDPRGLYQESIKIKTFDHDYDESISYCPKTGKELWMEEEQPIKGYDPDESTLLGYKVHLYSDDKAVVSILSCSSDKYDGFSQRIMGPSINIAYNDLKEDLEPLSLWNEEDFGLFSVMDIW